MYVLDDSGSMAWNYMPDNVFRTSGGDILNNCKRCTTHLVHRPGRHGLSNGWQCGNDENDPDTLVQHRADRPTARRRSTPPRFNKIWYNPNITYAPGHRLPGHEPRQRQRRTARANDAYLGGGNTNLVERLQGGASTATPAAPRGADLTNPAKCRKNGIHNVTPFVGDDELLPLLGQHRHQRRASRRRRTTTRSSSRPRTRTTTTSRRTSTAATSNLVNCVLATAAGASPGSPNTIAAPVRWCKTAADAACHGRRSPATPAARPRCQKKFDRPTTRTRATAASRAWTSSPPTADLPEGPDSVRTDCAAAASCTYAEEIQNFANWWTLLPHAHGAHEDRHGPRVPRPSTTASASASSRSTRTTRSPPTSTSRRREVRRHPEGGLVQEALPARTRTAARPTGPRCTASAATTRATTDGINDGMKPDPGRVLVPAELRPPHDGRLLERHLLVHRQRGQHQQRLHDAGLRRLRRRPHGPRTRSPTWRPTTTRRTCAPPARCRRTTCPRPRATRTRRSTW